MNNLIYIGSLSTLLRSTFGDKIQEEFLRKNLPFIVYDFDEMKAKSSDICAKLDYEYVDEWLFSAFVTKWRTVLQEHNQRSLDLRNLKKIDF